MRQTTTDTAMQQVENAESTRTHDGGRPQPRRHLVDGQGDSWEVYEFGAIRRTGREVPPVLIFETSTRWRRVKRYPLDWAELPDDDLMELSRHP